MASATTDGARTALHSLLVWYREMGIDAAVGDVPVDWRTRGDDRPGTGYAFPAADVPTASQPAARAGVHASTPESRAGPLARARPLAGDPRPPQLVSTQPRPVARPFPTTPPDAATLAARDAARSARSIDELATHLAAFDGCALKATAKSLCFYRGTAPARVLVVGEAPGADEDKLGRPFVGPAGQLLDKMLAAIGLGEANAHITNIVYWRPPGNRTPTPQEAMVCRPFLERQVELVAPEVILLLGGAAAKHVLDVPDGIMRLRGQWRAVEIGSHRARAIATLHPAYLLRTPIAKRLAWRDLLAVEAALAGSGK